MKINNSDISEGPENENKKKVDENLDIHEQSFQAATVDISSASAGIGSVTLSLSRRHGSFRTSRPLAATTNHPCLSNSYPNKKSDNHSVNNSLKKRKARHDDGEENDDDDDDDFLRLTTTVVGGDTGIDNIHNNKRNIDDTIVDMEKLRKRNRFFNRHNPYDEFHIPTIPSKLYKFSTELENLEREFFSTDGNTKKKPTNSITARTNGADDDGCEHPTNRPDNKITTTTKKNKISKVYTKSNRVPFKANESASIGKERSLLKIDESDGDDSVISILHRQPIFTQCNHIPLIQSVTSNPTCSNSHIDKTINIGSRSDHDDDINQQSSPCHHFKPSSFEVPLSPEQNDVVAIYNSPVFSSLNTINRSKKNSIDIARSESKQQKVTKAGTRHNSMDDDHIISNSVHPDKSDVSKCHTSSQNLGTDCKALMCKNIAISDESIPEQHATESNVVSLIQETMDVGKNIDNHRLESAVDECCRIVDVSTTTLRDITLAVKTRLCLRKINHQQKAIIKEYIIRKVVQQQQTPKIPFETTGIDCTAPLKSVLMSQNLSFNKKDDSTQKKMGNGTDQINHESAIISSLSNTNTETNPSIREKGIEARKSELSNDCFANLNISQIDPLTRVYNSKGKNGTASQLSYHVGSPILEASSHSKVANSSGKETEKETGLSIPFSDVRIVDDSAILSVVKKCFQSVNTATASVNDIVKAVQNQLNQTLNQSLKRTISKNQKKLIKKYLLRLLEEKQQNSKQSGASVVEKMSLRTTSPNNLIHATSISVINKGNCTSTEGCINATECDFNVKESSSHLYLKNNLQNEMNESSNGTITCSLNEQRSDMDQSCDQNSTGKIHSTSTKPSTNDIECCPLENLKSQREVRLECIATEVETDTVIRKCKETATVMSILDNTITTKTAMPPSLASKDPITPPRKPARVRGKYGRSAKSVSKISRERKNPGSSLTVTGNSPASPVAADDQIDELPKKRVRRKRGCPNPSMSKVLLQEQKAGSEKKAVGRVSTMTKNQSTRRAKCSLCSKCPCSFTNSSAGPDESALAVMSTSAIEIEKALIKRLQKLEMTADRYDEQRDAVRRRLVKHRREMSRAREEYLNRRSDKNDDQISGRNALSRFLPDAQQIDQQLDNDRRKKKRLNRDWIAHAQSFMFGSVAPSQPTLTQMLGTNERKLKDDYVCASSLEIQDQVGADSPPDNAQSKTKNGIQNRDESDQICDDSGSDDDRDDNDNYSIESNMKAHKLQMTSSSAKGNARFGSKQSLWASFTHRCFESAWDRLFFENDHDENGVDHLLELLDCEGNNHQESNHSPKDTPPPSPYSLSQRADSMVKNIVCKMDLEETDRVDKVKKVCPQWKENVAYAFSRNDSSEVSLALLKIQQSKEKLQRAKEAFLMSVEQRHVTLCLFEEALQRSQSRLIDDPVNNKVCDIESLSPTILETCSHPGARCDIEFEGSSLAT